MTLHFLPYERHADSMNAFQNMLGLNRRRNEHVARACISSDEFVLKLGNAFHEMRKRNGWLGGGWSDEALRQFQKDTVVRILVDDTQDVRQGASKVGGYVVHLGELIGFHCLIKGRGAWLFQQAMMDGARTLDTFDEGPMPELCRAYGWRVVRREPNHTKGGPDVLHFKNPHYRAV